MSRMFSRGSKDSHSPLSSFHRRKPQVNAYPFFRYSICLSLRAVGPLHSYLMKAQSAPTKPIEIISSDAAIGDEATHLAAVRDMFAAIAERYDFLNHFLSLNIDRYCRRKVNA